MKSISLLTKENKKRKNICVFKIHLEAPTRTKATVQKRCETPMYRTENVDLKAFSQVAKLAAILRRVVLNKHTGAVLIMVLFSV